VNEFVLSTIVTLSVNDKEVEFLARPGTTLLTTLRESLGLTGAKRGCAQGSCGSCAVLVDGKIVPSCLIPVETIQGAAVNTVEGLADGNQLSPLQQTFIEGFATQCGFCTSGMLMSATALLADNPTPTRDDVVRAISGNVCRCTGYEPIIEAILEGARVARAMPAEASDERTAS
jgi:carbon-monoxide dehydrogenase small subunit